MEVESWQISFLIFLMQNYPSIIIKSLQEDLIGAVSSVVINLTFANVQVGYITIVLMRCSILIRH